MQRRQLLGYLFAMASVGPRLCWSGDEQKHFDQALRNGELANEGFRRCLRYVHRWLQRADPETGLIPRNRRDQYWNAKDAAADNYPFMVLTTFFTDRGLFEGKMQEILRTEISLTSRIGALPDTYDFDKRGFPRRQPKLEDILFGASEYVKDGLLPLTEWLGPSPWSERLIAILNDIWKHAPIATPYGPIVSTHAEVNGNMLQVLSRIYWLTGHQKYLDWAIRLGDYYLLGNQHPTRDTPFLSLRAHGCEVISGLCELYATLHFVMPQKKQSYQQPLHEMLDRILEVGRTADGLFFNAINPIAGTRAGKKGIADTWGYPYNGIYTVYLIDGTQPYREATLKVLSNIHKYRNYPWEGGSFDGYADAIESGLNLYNRERITSVAQWIDSEIQVMWRKQKSTGIIGDWHGDGNFARTTLMYCLWKTQGLWVQPWNEAVFVGAVQNCDYLYLCLSAARDWSGKVHFDSPRHQTHMKLPLDWPRLNQFPEWFTVDSEASYVWRDRTTGDQQTYSGQQLREGIYQSLQAGVQKQIRIENANSTCQQLNLCL